MRTVRHYAGWMLLMLANALPLASEPSVQYRFDSWTVENGLPDNSIWAIRQTRDGYLWMTTSSSMVRFDGVRFREFNRLNTPGLNAEGFAPYALLEDRQGCLWAGTFATGAVRYCQGVFTTFTTRDGLPGNRVIRIDEDEEGVIWFYTDPGLAKWKDGRIIRVAPVPGSPFNEVLLAPGDKVGVDGYLFGLWRIGKNRWQRFARGHWSEFPLTSGRGGGASDLSISSIVEDSMGRLWYRFKHDFPTYYCLSQGRVIAFKDTPVKSAVSYQDSQGNLWESAQDGRTNLWGDGHATPLDGFNTPYVFRALEDREGSLWLGTSKSGLFRATAAVITTYRNTGGPQLNVIQPVLEDRDGSIWYGTHGLFHLSNGQSRAFYRADPAIRPAVGGSAPNLANMISALYQDHDGAIWAGTWDGVARLSGGGELVSDGPAAGIRGPIRAIHRDHEGDLWIGGHRGLYRIHGTKLTHFTVMDGLAGDDVQVIREGRNGALWVGTASGLSMRTGERFARIAAQGPDTQYIASLYEDAAGVLWIGTYGVGLYRFEPGKLTHYTDSNALSSNNVYQILEDDRGFFWLSGPTGIQRVRKEDLNAFSAGRRTAFAATLFGLNLAKAKISAK